MIKGVINIFVILLTTITFSQNMSNSDYIQKEVKFLVAYLKQNKRSIESFDFQLETNNSFIYKLKNEIVILPGNLDSHENGLIVKNREVFEDMLENDYFPIETNSKAYYEVFKEKILKIPNNVSENIMLLEKTLDIKIDKVEYDEVFFQTINSAIRKKLKVRSKLHDDYLVELSVLLGEIIVKRNGGYWELEKQYGLFNPYFIPNIIYNNVKLSVIETILIGLEDIKHFDLKFLYKSLVDPNLNLNLNPDVKEFYKNNFGNGW